jgi:hypothetical protein
MPQTADTDSFTTPNCRDARSRQFDHRLSRRAVALSAAALLLVGTAACSDDTASVPDDTASVPDATSAPWGTTSDTPVTTAAVDSADLDSIEESGLTDDELAGLLWMREEEQLAHDVYVALGDMWGLRIFENIAASETSHIDAVASLLDRYGIEDPALGNEPGTFTDPAMQELYDQLVTDGSESLEEALAVGAFIEELDIRDLQTRTATTGIAEIVTVYENLERGSRNHLRAFYSQLVARDVVYEPTQLDQAAFDAIVSSETERGRDG